MIEFPERMKHIYVDEYRDGKKYIFSIIEWDDKRDISIGLIMTLENIPEWEIPEGEEYENFIATRTAGILR